MNTTPPLHGSDLAFHATKRQMVADGRGGTDYVVAITCESCDTPEVFATYVSRDNTIQVQCARCGCVIASIAVR